MNAIDSVFYIAILIMSVVIHEISHGFIAFYFGDNTAKDEGRLTINPLHHLDLFGSIILPAFLYISAGFVFGWAKPVPYNPDNLRNKKWGSIAVASAGVLANFFIALLFGLILRFISPYFESDKLIHIMSFIVMINLSLALFNLVPIPPLDGSKIIFNLLPNRFYKFINFMEQYAFLFLIIFIFLFSNYLALPLDYLFELIVGFSF